MTETLENTDPVPRTRHDGDRHGLYRVLAWVGIAAGALFIVATVFFSGFIIGRHSGGGWQQGGPNHMMLRPFPGPDGPMGPGGPMAGPDDGPRSERLTSPPAPPTTPPRP